MSCAILTQQIRKRKINKGRYKHLLSYQIVLIQIQMISWMALSGLEVSGFLW
jgi:hypothetical protein